MAYSPIDQGALAAAPGLRAVAAVRGATPAQVALAWVMSRPGVMAIPKSGDAAHLRDNLAAAQMRLDEAELSELDRLFPPPRRKRPLAVN
jgi:diketogulonate reductase-like aldo/keto reductase